MRRTARHARPPMVRRRARARRPRPAWAAVVLALGFGAGMASGGVMATWRDAAPPLPSISTGITLFSVGDPQAGGAPLPPPPTTQWDMGTAGLGTATQPLAPGGTFADAVQIDAVSQGNRGLAWGLDRVTIADPAGTGYLAARLSVRIVQVSGPQACTVEATASGTALYDGPLADATIAARELVPAAAPGGTAAAPVTAYLCLGLTLDPTMETTYRNVATITGQGSGAAGDPVDVSATDDWNATLVAPAGATNPQVTFWFDSITYRGELP